MLKAIAEYDRIGKNAFLVKYKFRPAKSNFIVIDDRFYDAKAIIGAAHGYQHRMEGPLAAEDFIGDVAAVKSILERMGFEMNT